MDVMPKLSQRDAPVVESPTKAPSVSLRVLHVLEATLGGTRRYLEDIASTTSDLPITHGLVYGTSRADGGLPHLLADAAQSGWYLAPVETMKRPISLLDDARSVSSVRRSIEAFRPNILHLHSAKGGGIGRLATLRSRFHFPRVVYSPHALPTRVGRMYMLAERALARLTDRFIAVSDSERREIVANGLANFGQVDVVYPSIDAEHYAPQNKYRARRALCLPDGVPTVIGIGRLASQKDPLSFVSIVGRLRSILPSLIGIWVGDGELRPQVEALSADLGLGEAFRIAGWVPDVRPYIAASDVLLSTSKYESFGYAVAEAFAMERPVVATRVTGTIDVFGPDAESLLYSAGRTDDSITALLRVLEDAALRNRVTHFGRSSVIRRFSKSAMLQSLYDSYSAALA